MCTPLFQDARPLLRLRRLLLSRALGAAGRAQRPRHVAAQRAQRAALQHGVQRPALFQQRLQVVGQRPRRPPRRRALRDVVLEACRPRGAAF